MTITRHIVVKKKQVQRPGAAGIIICVVGQQVRYAVMLIRNIVLVQMFQQRAVKPIGKQNAAVQLNQVV